MARGAALSGALKLSDILSNLLPDALRGRKPYWPPDAFALAASVLKMSGAYTKAVNRWPPPEFSDLKAWRKAIQKLSGEWRNTYAAGGWPGPLDDWWRTVIDATTVNIRDVAQHQHLVDALVAIVAVSDQTSFGFGIVPSEELDRDPMDDRALRLLLKSDTLCQDIDPSRVVVLPKLHNPLTGMTLRSLTHNLALWDTSEVLAHWEQVALPQIASGMNVLLLPWPLEVVPNAFRIADGLAEQLPRNFGFFAYEIPDSTMNIHRVRGLLDRARHLVGRIDAVVLPELSLTDSQFDALRNVLPDQLLIAGTGRSPVPPSFGYNGVSISVPKTSVVRTQGKHHRWRLEDSQIEQYGLCNLTEQKWWWEAIDISDRSCTFFSANEWLTFCVLICEDLARQDPVAELVRSVGPNLVIALLLDGPQMAERWSARYATVLAEDPRSSVLTLTSAGLVDLARSQRRGGPRSIALWKDAISGKTREICLDDGAEGVVLTLSSEMHKEWTADGRHDDKSTGYLRLMGVHQLFDR